MISLTMDLSVKEGRMDAFLELLLKVLPETRGYDGCERFDVWIDTETNNRVVFSEDWQSKEKQQAYLQWRIDTGVFDVLLDYLNSPPETEYFELLDG